MNITDFSALVSRHRHYFRTGATRSVEWRESQLKALSAMMKDRAEDFYASRRCGPTCAVTGPTRI